MGTVTLTSFYTKFPKILGLVGRLWHSYTSEGAALRAWSKILFQELEPSVGHQRNRIDGKGIFEKKLEEFESFQQIRQDDSISTLSGLFHADKALKAAT